MVEVKVEEGVGMGFWLDLQNQVEIQHGVRSTDILCGMALWL